MRRMVPLLAALAILDGGTALAQSAAVARGRQIAATACARCHAVERTGESPNPRAPPFRALHQRYPVANLEEALAEGIFVGHAEMPQFEFDPSQIGDFIAYLTSLER